MTSIFDPNLLLDATIDAPTEARPPLPVQDYTAIIGEIAARQFQGKKDPSKTFTAWDVPLTLQIPVEVQQQLGIELAELKLTDSIMLDLTESGTLDNSLGKNGKLRMYREALDMNKPGDTFSARKMQGQVVTVRVNHEDYEGRLMERVGKVARAL